MDRGDLKAVMEHTTLHLSPTKGNRRNPFGSSRNGYWAEPSQLGSLLLISWRCHKNDPLITSAQFVINIWWSSIFQLFWFHLDSVISRPGFLWSQCCVFVQVSSHEPCLIFFIDSAWLEESSFHFLPAFGGVCSPALGPCRLWPSALVNPAAVRVVWRLCSLNKREESWSWSVRYGPQCTGERGD